MGLLLYFHYRHLFFIERDIVLWRHWYAFDLTKVGFFIQWKWTVVSNFLGSGIPVGSSEGGSEPIYPSLFIPDLPQSFLFPFLFLCFFFLLALLSCGRQPRLWVGYSGVRSGTRHTFLYISSLPLDPFLLSLFLSPCSSPVLVGSTQTTRPPA